MSARFFLYLHSFVRSTRASRPRIVNINEHPGSLPRSSFFFFSFFSTPDPWLGSLISSAFSLVGGRPFDHGNESSSQAPRTTSLQVKAAHNATSSFALICIGCSTCSGAATKFPLTCHYQNGRKKKSFVF